MELMNFKSRVTVEEARNLWGDEQFEYMFMTIEEFTEGCKCGGFIDYDGFGDWVIDGKLVDSYSDPMGPALPSRIMEDDIPDGVTHVVWYNK
jgi:hypothetical protein